jgi:histidine kinase
MKKTNKQEAIDEKILLTMLNKIDSNIDRASKIINHMRQFSRMSNMGMEKVQINEVLEKVFEIFNQQLKTKGIIVVKDIDDNIPLIMGDPNRLEQVFINLLLNARDAVEERWGDKECKPGSKIIQLKTKCEGESIVVKICDTGPGIPKAILEKIFEPFFTTKEVGKGTGLGLSISYGIIKDCGGDIQIDTSREEGAAFVIKLPMMEKI